MSLQAIITLSIVAFFLLVASTSGLLSITVDSIVASIKEHVEYKKTCSLLYHWADDIIKGIAPMEISIKILQEEYHERKDDPVILSKLNRMSAQLEMLKCRAMQLKEASKTKDMERAWMLHGTLLTILDDFQAKLNEITEKRRYRQ